MHKLHLEKHPGLEPEESFEAWLKKKIEDRKSGYRTQAEVVTIPVVVHIIHKGENIGIGTNIPEGQVFSQIEVLNEDFRRTNDDAANTPSEFEPVAADIELEFTLAKRDPEGLPTNGIVRVQGTKDVWDVEEEYDFKRLSYWPSEDYLNIWVLDLSGLDLGFAQFPVASTLDGLEEAVDYSLTDGVVIDYTVFGSVEKYLPANLNPSYNLGRTTTHEIGHFFGLRHIWGDGGCAADDYCADTPRANSSNLGLNACAYPGPSSCSSNDMFQNYMDYTDDVCMNLYTVDQKNRMRTVLENSPRRVSLKSSSGGIAPPVTSNDLGVRTILEPGQAACANILTPSVEVRNYGENKITSTTISVFLDGIPQQTETFSLDLDPLETDTLLFNEILFTASSTYDILFQITQTNSTTDGYAANDQKALEFTMSELATIPLIEQFDVLPDDWFILNPDNSYTWQLSNAPNGGTGNQALFINFYDYEFEQEQDYFISPSIDLTMADAALLSFDVAYAPFSYSYDEGLIVKILDECSQDPTQGNVIYEKYTEGLSTVEGTRGSFFTPSGADEWREELVDLSGYVGHDRVRLVFIAKNDYGNNLYLDNISLTVEAIENITLKNTTSPSIISCQPDQSLALEVQNSSIVPVGSFTIEYILDGNTQQVSVELEDSLQFQDIIEVNVSLPELEEGEHSLSLELSAPNDNAELRTNDNSSSFNFVVNQATEVVPVKETFEDFTSSGWAIVNTDGEATWEVTSTNLGKSAVVKGFEYENTGATDWLVSPILDFTTINFAELDFKYAYSHLQANDELRVMISTDCGSTFEEVYSRIGTELGSINSSVESFIPASTTDWDSTSIDLFEYVGASDVRIAFAFTNQNGNNFYLDDIQLYITQGEYKNVTTIYPNPTEGPFYVTFDRPVKEEVQIRVYNMTGALVAENTFPNTLNQTYTVDLSSAPKGLYLVRVQGDTFSFTKRIFYRR